jgi:hypothetical protein
MDQTNMAQAALMSAAQPHSAPSTAHRLPHWVLPVFLAVPMGDSLVYSDTYSHTYIGR